MRRPESHCENIHVRIIRFSSSLYSFHLFSSSLAVMFCLHITVTSNTRTLQNLFPPNPKLMFSPIKFRILPYLPNKSFYVKPTNHVLSPPIPYVPFLLSRTLPPLLLLCLLRFPYLFLISLAFCMKTTALSIPAPYIKLSQAFSAFCKFAYYFLSRFASLALIGFPSSPPFIKSASLFLFLFPRLI